MPWNPALLISHPLGDTIILGIACGEMSLHVGILHERRADGDNCLAGTGCESAVGTDLRYLTRKGAFGLSQPEQKRREIT